MLNMKRIFVALIVPAVLLSNSLPVLSSPGIHLLAPAEESFVGMEPILIIGQVEGANYPQKVQILDNGNIIGSVLIRGGTFTYRARLAEGRHEIVFKVPGLETKTVKIFVGRQEGYRYHIETTSDSCGDCHAEASRHLFSVGHMQEEICSKCHDPMGSSEYVHGPVAAGSCTPCHDPHGSRYEKFLVATGKELCLFCHSQNLSKKHVEERQNAQCVKCHDPHSSARNYHLR